MKDTKKIIKLAKQRLSEARILCKNNKYEGAFYLAGYSVELMLKAKICERLGIPNLFDEAGALKDQPKGIGEVRKALKTHNLHILLIYSGLKVKFDKDKASNKKLFKVNSLFFNGWDEKTRYKPCGYMHDKDAKNLVTLLSQSNGMLTWIEN